MNIEIVKAGKDDVEVLYKLVLELSSGSILDHSKFQQYYFELLKAPNSDIWLLEINGSKVGYVLANKTYLMRYMGFAVEIEEIVVNSEYRGKGLGEKFIQRLMEKYKSQKDCRKIVIKTNDLKGSARLYERLFDKTDLMYFQKFLNKI